MPPWIDVTHRYGMVSDVQLDVMQPLIITSCHKWRDDVMSRYVGMWCMPTCMVIFYRSNFCKIFFTFLVDCSSQLLIMICLKEIFSNFENNFEPLDLIGCKIYWSRFFEIFGFFLDFKSQPLVATDQLAHYSWSFALVNLE